MHIRYRIVLALLILPIFFFASCKPRESAPPQIATDRTIFQIIEEGDTTAFVYWMDQAPDLNQRGAGGVTPLHVAIQFGRSGYVMDLIGQGANVNLADDQHLTPLHIAAQFGRTAIISLLIDAGANIQASNQDGLTPFDFADLHNQLEARAALESARAALLAPPRPEAPAGAESEQLPDIPPALLLSTDFRHWTSTSGDKIEAAFIQNIFDSVTLQNREGAFFRIPLNRLVPADQILVRQLSGVDPHALAKARSSRTSTVRAATQDSMALKIGKDDDWTVLADCRLLRSGGNDGDSFHVKHDGKEYIFRLYFVDAAETVMTYPDRVRHQAEYFNLNDEDTVKLGEAAKKFTLSLLASGPFTVVTKWEDAKGSSHLPRYFALVATAQGDLDELLVQEGLVRRYGMPVKNSIGQRKLARLKHLENEAKNQKVGAWARQNELSASR